MGEIAGIPNKRQSTAQALDRLTELVEEMVGQALSVRTIESARARAQTLERGLGSSEGTIPLVLASFIAELLGSVAVDLAADRARANELISKLEAETGIDRIALGREVLRPAQPPQLPTDIAIEVHLALLVTFSGVSASSLWSLWPNGELRHVSHAGEFEPLAQPAREAARALLADELPIAGPEAGVRIERLREPPAALVACGLPDQADGVAPLLDAAAQTILTLLDRELLLSRDEGSEQTVMSSVERRLARLRFDLHDGPQQDVHLLAQDLRLFREQLRPMITADANADRLLGRLDDLEAQVVALDGDLRRLATSVQSPFLQSGSLTDVLGQMVDAFAARTGFAPTMQLDGDLSRLSDSQQITLLALIREALTNIREHSEASAVAIAISSDARSVSVQITDDGRGFDPEATLVRAARAGRLGLVGMHERVRMLGGRTQIDSRPGGPTVISATLPSWPGRGG